MDATSPPEPKPIRDAATVIVLREGGDGPEVLMVRRHARSGFAADMWVFPGGVIDPGEEHLDPARWRGISPEALADRFGDPPGVVLAAHVAAVRETFEEAGLLLAHRADGSRPDVTEPAVVALRAALADRQAVADFRGWLDDEELVLDLGALTYWSRWITPPLESKRFDTRFFLARAPEGQVAVHDEVEVTEQQWVTPQAALDAHSAGDLKLIYPTVKTLEEMAPAASIDELVAHAEARPEVETILPHAEFTDEGEVVILHPTHPDYPWHLYAHELGQVRR